MSIVGTIITFQAIDTSPLVTINARKTRKRHSTPNPFTANRDGFSLNTAVAWQVYQRDWLDCRLPRLV